MQQSDLLVVQYFNKNDMSMKNSLIGSYSNGHWFRSLNEKNILNTTCPEAKNTSQRRFSSSFIHRDDKNYLNY